MLDFIERLRQKPAALRAQIVFVSAAAITGIIFFIWVSVISVQFGSIAPPEGERSEEESDSVTSFSDVREDISALFDLGRTELQEELQKEFYSDTLSDTESGVPFSEQELQYIEEGVGEESTSDVQISP